MGIAYKWVTVCTLHFYVLPLTSNKIQLNILRLCEWLYIYIYIYIYIYYINERWCTDVTVLKKMCCSDLELLFINCKPFYSPREFCSFILLSVYIPPQAHLSSALQKLADQITDTEQQHSDSVLIILGDFNKANLSRELPKYRQHVTCPTRDSNILDHCYTTIKDAYHSVPRAALGLSDHCLGHLIPIQAEAEIS